MDLKKLEVTRLIGEVVLKAAVSPCSWMYAGYGLQIAVSLPDGGKTYVHRRDLPFERATEGDVRGLLDSVRIIPCKKCGSPAFDPADAGSRRDGECEPCSQAEARAALNREQQAETIRRLKIDAERRKDGFTHRIDAWIHRDEGGDDGHVCVYMRNPTANEIRKLLVMEGSLDPNDYCVCPLH